MSPISLSRRLVRLLISRADIVLPDAIGEKARIHVADAIGIALAASKEPTVGAKLLGALAGGGDAGAAALFGDKRRAAPALAAFHNASLVHILDFDDIHDEARVHPTAVTLPSALAVLALCPPEADSRLLHAVALGNELMCRLGLMWNPLGTGPGSDWFLTQTFGYFGGALSAGIMLGLGEDQMVSALGLAYMQAAGGKEAGFGVGSTARAIYPGFAAMGAVHAALLARSGVIGPESALDGAANLFKLYLGREPDPNQLSGLIDPSGWAWTATKLKPYPCCRLSHPYVAAAQDLRAKIRGQKIRRIIAYVNPSASKLCSPLDDRRRPRTLQDAKYSIPFMVAFALTFDQVDLESLSVGSMDGDDLRELVDRVEIVNDLPDRPGLPRAIIVVETDSGVARSAMEEDNLDLGRAAAKSKFMRCLAYAGRDGKLPATALWHKLVESKGGDQLSYDNIVTAT